MAEQTIADKIEENAKGPARVTVDGSTVEAQNIHDQITAEKHLAAKTASTKKYVGMTVRLLVPPPCG